jgi:hypothetical protein
VTLVGLAMTVLFVRAPMIVPTKVFAIMQLATASSDIPEQIARLALAPMNVLATGNVWTGHVYATEVSWELTVP